MPSRIIGISGSPINNSNTDRLVKAVMEHSGMPGSFIKLASRHVQPCRGCLGCVHDNLCRVQDDFQEIAALIKKADAMVIGGYPPYGTIDAFTKAFLERLFSLRHRTALNRGKLAVTVVTGNGRGAVGINEASAQLKRALTHEQFEIIGQIKAQGNVKCTFCGQLETCPMSALPRLFAGDMTLVPKAYCRVEDQTDTWHQAIELGEQLGRRLAAQASVQ